MDRCSSSRFHRSHPRVQSAFNRLCTVIVNAFHAASEMPLSPRSQRCQVRRDTNAYLAAVSRLSPAASRAALISAALGLPGEGRLQGRPRLIGGRTVVSCSTSASHVRQSLDGIIVSPASHRCQVRAETLIMAAANSLVRPALTRAARISAAAGLSQSRLRNGRPRLEVVRLNDPAAIRALHSRHRSGGMPDSPISQRCQVRPVTPTTAPASRAVNPAWARALTISSVDGRSGRSSERGRPGRLSMVQS